MTVTQLVSRALRLLAVCDVSTPPSNADIETAIVALNQMLSRWEADGLALGWSAVALSTDTVPLPEEAEGAVAYNLACELRPEYGVALAQDIYLRAQQLLGKLIRDRAVEMPMSFDRAGMVYDITTDSYR